MFVDDALLARQHRLPIDFYLRYFDAEFTGVLEGVVDLGMMKQNVRQNTTNMQARATEKAVFFDHQRFQAPLRGTNRGDISAGSAANNRQIVCRQSLPPSFSGKILAEVNRRRRVRHQKRSCESALSPRRNARRANAASSNKAEILATRRPEPQLAWYS